MPVRCAHCNELVNKGDAVPLDQSAVPDYLCKFCVALGEADPLPEKPHEFFPRPENWRGR
jgi:hypothetical protein